MITEDFCSLEVAKLLKEKGFDELCIFKYNSEGVRMKAGVAIDEWQNSELDDDECSCVSHQTAMKWLREMHKIQICVEQNPYDVWHYWGFSMSYIDEKINELPNPTQAFIHICPTKIPNNCYKTYEEAVEAACIYALKNLI